MVIAYFVRHGETEWNKQGKLQGHTDIPLNETGRAQAQVLKEQLSDIAFEAAFSSDLRRAYETATIVCGDRVRQDRRLRERGYGPCEGLSCEEGRKRLSRQSEGAESLEEVEARVLHFLEELVAHYAGKNVFVATHGGLMKILFTRLTNRSAPPFIVNTGLLRFSHHRGQWVHDQLRFPLGPSKERSARASGRAL